MKYAVLLLIGLFVGAVGAGVVVNTLRQRDAYQRGMMEVMQHHYLSLREELRSRTCDATTSGQLKSALAITRMRTLTDDIEPAFYADTTPDTPFREFTQRLRDALSEVPSPPPTDCAALAPMVQKIGKVCEECHQQYR